MPIKVYSCPQHSEIIEKKLVNTELEPELYCPICNSKLEKQLSNSTITSVKEMADKGRNVQREVNFTQRAEKRKNEHFTNQEIHGIIAEGGTMDRETAIKRNVFQKEGGRYRVKKKEDLK